jgi:hypothetical protein
VNEVVHLVVLGEGAGEVVAHTVEALRVRHPDPHPEVVARVELADPVDQFGEQALALIDIPAVHPGVLPGQAEFGRARVKQRPGAVNVLLDGRRLDAARRALRDTVRAVAHTPACERENADLAVQHRLRVRRRRRALAVANRDRHLLPVTDPGVEVFELLALRERHTARDDEVRRLVGEFLGASAHVALGFLHDRTGVEDSNVRRRWPVDGVVAGVAKPPLYLFALTPVGCTAVRLDMVASHPVVSG